MDEPQDTLIQSFPLGLSPGSVYTFIPNVHPSHRVNVTKMALVQIDIHDGWRPVHRLVVETPHRPYAALVIRAEASMNIRVMVRFDGPGAKGKVEVWREAWESGNVREQVVLLTPQEVPGRAEERGAGDLLPSLAAASGPQGEWDVAVNEQWRGSAFWWT
jgi:hypothetical protein